jgi:hypothetical protein
VIWLVYATTISSNFLGFGKNTWKRKRIDYCSGGYMKRVWIFSKGFSPKISVLFSFLFWLTIIPTVLLIAVAICTLDIVKITFTSCRWTAVVDLSTKLLSNLLF